MFRFVLLMFFLAGSYSLPSAVQAQGSAKAYAPENLRQLSYSERIRVIENEYYEQSNGRDIPDDQLEFYMDSVESGWTFSRIRQDIATSLGANNDGSWSPDGNWNQRNVICSSVKNRYTECRTPFRGRAIVLQQISKTRCQEGSNWGQRQGMIWVNKGCRAQFGETSGGSGWGNGNNWGDNRITCESNNSQYRECRTNFRGAAQLYRKLSNSSCDEGRDWGTRSGYVWVRNGCRAEFYDSNGGYDNNNGNYGNGWGNNNYTVTCTSDGSDFKTCYWDHRYGSPRLVRQISKKSCISGRTWGYDNRGLWVNNGCRAVFGTR
jgi:hypothetical protein